MSKTEATTPLSTMLGSGESFEVNGKAYTIKPIKLKDVDEFMKDNLSMGSQFFNLAKDDAKEKTNKWLCGYCVDNKDEAMTLEKAMQDDWDLAHLKDFFKKLCDLSG